MSNFDSDPLTFDIGLFFAKSSQNGAKNNRILPGKERGDTVLIFCGIWIARWLKFFIENA